MKSWNTKHHPASASLLTPRFRQAMLAFLGRYSPHSKPVKTFPTIIFNRSMPSGSHDQYFPIVKLQSGGCDSCKGVLGNCEYPWGLRIWRRGQISLKVVSAFTTFACGWLESTRSRTCMFLCGVRVRGRGSGRVLGASYFLTNGNTTMSALFIFKRSGIKQQLD